ncbi:MAG: OmpA family protein [Gammaproteobacteria bacterium]|nr:OmpA family protein [Gammaproteobacteria bacterium]
MMRYLPALAALLLATPLVAAEPVTYTDAQGNVMTFQLGDSAFADREVSYAPGDPEPNQDARDGSLATGAPNYKEPGDGSYTTLGCGGTLVLQFTDNTLVDQAGPDLHVFEVGPDVEPTFVAVSTDGENWVELGKIDGGDASLDIGEHVQGDATYRFVRFTDDGKGCRGRWPGADIDAVGALNAAQMIQLAGNLLFATDSNSLRAEARQELQRIAQSLRDAGVEEVTIVGHTDARGDAAYNEELSRQRAAAVRDYLRDELGVTEIELAVKGAGETQPVATNDTPEGRQQNRRVEFIF